MRTPDEEMKMLKSILWTVAKCEDDVDALVGQICYLANLYDRAKSREEWEAKRK